MSKINPLVDSIRLVNLEARKTGGTVFSGGFYGNDAIVILASNEDVYIISVEEAAAAKVISKGEEKFQFVGTDGVAVTYEYRVALNKAGEIGLFRPNSEEHVLLIAGEAGRHFQEASRRAILLRLEALAEATLPT